MLKTLIFLCGASIAASFSVTMGQSADPAGQGGYANQPAAPITRPYADGVGNYGQAPRAPRRSGQITDSQPVNGVWLRTEASGAVKTITANDKSAEFRLEHGRLNVNVHQPAQHIEILVDLPGGQISLLKDGVYTFNADTNTVRVLRGEAAAYPGATKADAKPIKVKEDHQLAFAAGGGTKSVEAYPFELTADLLPLGGSRHGDGEYEYGGGYPPYPSYGYGYYGYPYYAGAWGYPYGWGYGYPYAYGIGFGYYGGFRGGFGGFRR